MPHKAQSPKIAELRAKLEFITEAELGGLLCNSIGRLRNRQAAGDLPPRYKVGRDKLYKLSEVEAWISRRRVSRASA
jgi:predicted DNA-binding transcriptional regulator AlpA